MTEGLRSGHLSLRCRPRVSLAPFASMASLAVCSSPVCAMMRGSAPSACSAVNHLSDPRRSARLVGLPKIPSLPGSPNQNPTEIRHPLSNAEGIAVEPAVPWSAPHPWPLRGTPYIVRVLPYDDDPDVLSFGQPWSA